VLERAAHRGGGTSLERRMSNIALGELREEVIYSMQQPHVRLHNMDFRQDKKKVKEVLRNQARGMNGGTHYVLENDLLDVIIPSLRRGSIRQFVNAYWNARPPHKSFFVEWDHGYLLKQLEKVSERKKYLDDQTVLAGVSSTYAGPSHLGTVRAGQGNNAEKEEVRIPCCQVVRFFTGQSQPLNEARERKKALINLSPGELHQFSSEDLEAHAEKFGWFSLPPDLFQVGIRLFQKWFQLDNIEPYDELVKVGASCLPSQHEACHFLMSPYGTGAPSHEHELFRGWEFVHFQVFIAAISLLNFDWVVNKEDGTVARGTKSINTEAFPQNRYKRVTINLPKDKAIAEFHKQKIRTRKFGTADHIVRGHWRLYKKTGERVWIKEHHRGDEEFGTVHKDYVLTKRDGYLK